MKRIQFFICLLLLLSARGYSQCNATSISSGYAFSAFATVNVDGMQPWGAFDQSDSSALTHWGSANSTNTVQEIGVDFGLQSFDFCSVSMKWGVNEYPVHFLIQGTTSWSEPYTTLADINDNHQNELTVTGLPAGSYHIFRILTISREATSTTYNLYDCKIFTRIVNSLPAVSLTGPANGMSYLKGNSVEITANATDADGTISKVEFYRDATLIGTDTSRPFSFVWANPDTGHYAIFAKATDNLTATKKSDTAKIVVTNAPASLRSWNLTGSTIYNSNTGYVAIGAIPANLPSDTTIKLTVNGYIYARKLRITQTSWADYVFKPSYRLKPLKEVESFIRKNNHLPDVPSAAEVARNGINVGDSQAVLLKKIEELTLYLINQNKMMMRMQQEIGELKKAKLRK